MRTILSHPLSKEWELINQKKYGEAYSEMHSFFLENLSNTFEKSEIMIAKKSKEYLTRMFIEHIKMPTSPEQINIILNLRYNPHPNFDRARLWEYSGEVVLIYTGIFGKDEFYEEGKKSFKGAVQVLKNYFGGIPSNSELNKGLIFQSDRLKLDKTLADNYTSLVEVIENMGLINDPWYIRFKRMVNQL